MMLNISPEVEIVIVMLSPGFTETGLTAILVRTGGDWESFSCVVSVVVSGVVSSLSCSS